MDNTTEEKIIFWKKIRYYNARLLQSSEWSASELFDDPAWLYFL